MEIPTSNKLRQTADALTREMVELDIQILGARKRKIDAAVKREEIYTELKIREMYAA